MSFVTVLCATKVACGRATRLALAAAALACASLAAQTPQQGEPPRASEPAPSPAPLDWGLQRPRPADPEARQAQGLPAPRTPDVVIAELDALDAQYLPNSHEDPEPERTGAHNRALDRRWIDLVSELEEGGYAGPRLEALLEDKLARLDEVWGVHSIELESLRDARGEIARLHPGTQAAAMARASEIYQVVLAADELGLSLDDASLGRLAEAERARQDDDAGAFLLDGLRRLEGGRRDQWFEWILANLPERSRAHRYVLRKRAFDHPIRLRGTGFDGEVIDTADWKGSVVLVDFWGTWCVPCVEALSDIRRVRDEYAARGLRVVGVLCDFQVEKARAFAQQHGYDWPQLVDRSLTEATMTDHPVAQRYAIGGFPTLWIIDRAGVLREEVAADELEEAVRPYLDEPAPGESPR